MVCRRIHESLGPHIVKSDYDVGTIPNMHHVASTFKGNPTTRNLNTQFPVGHKKHHGHF